MKDDDVKRAIASAEEALAKQEQGEPVHIVNSNGRHSPVLTHMMNKRVEAEQFTSQPKQEQGEPTGMLHINRLDKWLDASLKERKQRTWVGLTDEDDIDWEDGGNLKDLVKAIEAKLKEKNT